MPRCVPLRGSPMTLVTLPPTPHRRTTPAVATRLVRDAADDCDSDTDELVRRPDGLVRPATSRNDRSPPAYGCAMGVHERRAAATGGGGTGTWLPRAPML